MILDSVIVSVYLNLPKDPSTSTNNLVFIVFVLLFIISNFFYIRYVKFGGIYLNQDSVKRVRLFYNVIFLNQSVIFVSLFFIIAHIIIFGNYSTSYLMMVIYFSYIPALGCLVFLVYLFIRWYMAGRSYLILGYTVAFVMISGTLLVSVTYLTIQFSFRNEVVDQDSVKTTVLNYSNYGGKLIDFGTVYTVLSILSFICVWILSVVSMRVYSKRMGRKLFWTLVLIPLIYFLFPIIFNKFGIVDALFFQYGHDFILLYYFIFSPYQQIGGLMFGLVFWVSARKIERANLKVLVNTAGIGIVLLFGSSALYGLTYIVAPPFGLITISYISMAAYLLLLGIFNSAKEFSRDSEIRKEIYKIAEEQFGLLQNISMADLVKKTQQIVNTAKDNIKFDDVSSYDTNDDADYKKFLQEVLEELSSQRSLNKG